jgi:hypothetical protein
MESVFDPELEKLRKEHYKDRRGTTHKDLPQKPLDVLLATNMISAGVDVKRLGVMIVGGQPKSTAEYIQATSRVGRFYPGLVCTVFNWARPRDLSHYETFEYYHTAFYQHVEPLSVTPFASGALQRGLAGLLVSLVRLHGTEFNKNEYASRITTGNPYIQEAIETISQRAKLIGDGDKSENICRDELLYKSDFWQSEAQNRTGGGILHYKKPYGTAGGTVVELLHFSGLERWEEFTCLNSLREVEPQIKFILSDGGLDDI